MKDKIVEFKLIEKEDIPRIPLYMDQVTGYLDELFAPIKRHDEEKSLTKTMINNYVKAGLISNPQKKKYGQEQIMQLIMIYLLKNTIQIQEIDTILKSESDKTALFNDFRKHFDEASDKLKQDTEKNADLNKRDQILSLLISSSIQKKYAEMLIDDLSNEK
jgi:hypothetical protein